MQDLERDLARYGTVLRDRTPAVGLDEVESRLDRTPSSHRPVRAAVAGALLALASIGLVFIGGLLVDLVGAPSPTHRLSVPPASGAAPGPTVMTVVVGSGALAVLIGAAAVGLRNRHKDQEPKRIIKSRERRKKRMQTLEKPTAPIEKLEKNNRYLIIALVVAVLIAAGLGAWLLVETIGNSTERQINALLDSYGTAWEANDGDAVLALMTEDGTVLAGNGLTYSGEALAYEVDNLGDFSVEPGDIVIREQAGGWHVASPDEHGLELFNIVDRDGTLLIKFHETWRGGN